MIIIITIFILVAGIAGFLAGVKHSKKANAIKEVIKD